MNTINSELFNITIKKFGIFVLLLNNLFGFAQADIDFNISKFVTLNDNISSNTGIHTENIPLHLFKGKEMNLPISLNYTASGIKVNQVANNVGLGWNLNVGGKIERVVVGVADQSNSNLGIPTGCRNVESGNQINNRDYYNVTANGFNDIFTFPNDAQGVVKSIVDPYIEISTENLAYSCDGNWIITDRDGTKYFFGQNNVAESIESINSFSNVNSLPDGGTAIAYCDSIPSNYTSAWMLTKIISKNGLDEYDFIYQQYQWSSYLTNSGEGYRFSFWNQTSPDFINNSSYKLKQQMLTEIRHNNYKIISLEYGQRQDIQFVGGSTIGNALNQIKFYNFSSNSIYKKIDFNYSYFGNNSSTNNTINKRLKLDSIVIFGLTQTGIVNEGDKYSFDYINPESIPDLNSKAQDYLGLYNGKDNNLNLIPNQLNIYQNTRDYNFNSSIIGTLNKITYPTKGYREFEFEQNSTDGGFGQIYHPDVYQTQFKKKYAGRIIIGSFCTDTPAREQLANPNMNYIHTNNFPNQNNSSNTQQYLTAFDSTLMRIDSNTGNDFIFNLYGTGVYLIQKLPNSILCDSANDVNVSCWEISPGGQIDDSFASPYNPCLRNLNTLFYNGINMSFPSEFIDGNYFNLGGNFDTTIHLEDGNYQITLWLFDGQEGSIRIYNNVVSNYVLAQAAYYENLDVNSGPLDGFRIKSISNYNEVSNRINKKRFIYDDALVDMVNNTYHAFYPFIGDINFYNSSGYLNSPEIVHYYNIKEVNLDQNENDIGSVKFEFIPQNGTFNYPFRTSSYGLNGSRTSFTSNLSKNSLHLKSVYDNLNNLQKREEFLYGNSIIQYPSVISVDGYVYYYNSDYAFLKEIKITDYSNLNTINSKIDRTPFLTEYLDNSFVPTYVENDTEFQHFGYNNLYNTNIPDEIHSTIKGDTKFIFSQLNGVLNSNPVTRYLVTEVQGNKRMGDALETKAKYEYDTDGNLVQTLQFTLGTVANNQYESVIWGYNNRFPVAKLVGVKYSQITSSRLTAIKNASNLPISDTNDNAMRTALNALRTDFPTALITTTTYNPVFGVTSVTDAKGYTLYTEYDVFGRVKYTKEKDAAGNFRILSENRYNTKSN